MSSCQTHFGFTNIPGIKYIGFLSCSHACFPKPIVFDSTLTDGMDTLSLYNHILKICLFRTLWSPRITNPSFERWPLGVIFNSPIPRFSRQKGPIFKDLCIDCRSTLYSSSLLFFSPLPPPSLWLRLCLKAESDMHETEI